MQKEAIWTWQLTTRLQSEGRYGEWLCACSMTASMLPWAAGLTMRKGGHLQVQGEQQAGDLAGPGEHGGQGVGRHLLLSLRLLGLRCSESGATKALRCTHRDCSSPGSRDGCLETEEAPKAGWKQTPRETSAPAAYLDEVHFPCALHPRGQDPIWPQATPRKRRLSW